MAGFIWTPSRYDIRKKKNYHFKVISKSVMVTSESQKKQKQKKTKKKKKKVLAFLNTYEPKTQLIKMLNFFYSSKPYVRLSGNLVEDIGELLFLDNDLRTDLIHTKSSKKHPDFWGMKTIQKPKTWSWIIFTYHSTIHMNSI